MSAPTWMPERDESVVQHEVFFEDGLSSIKSRPLFLGRAFPRGRYMAASVIAIVVLSLLLGRAAWMQVVEGERYQAQAESNRLRRVAIPPRRGMIRDRQGRILADNVPRFQVTLTPAELPREQVEQERVLGSAALLLGLPVADLIDLSSATGSARDEAFPAGVDLPYERAIRFAVELPDLPGFQLEVGARRRYPQSQEVQSLSHILGYLGKLSPDEYANARENGYRRSDDIGKTGIEKSYETLLRGALGERTSEVDAHGREQALVGDRPPVDGQDVTLALDLDLQKAAEQALRDQLDKDALGRGAVVAMDPRDGSILAIVSWPAFDNNVFSGSVSATQYNALRDNPDQPLFPRAWAGTYPSGSTVKIVVAAAAMIEKIVTPQTTIFSSGGIRVGPWFFPDWKAGGHGATNVRSAIAWSVNTFFYTVGGGYESMTGLGVARLSDWMRRFGLGSRTGIDLPNEGQGLVPDEDYKLREKNERWFVGDTYNLSIGQGDLLVTPIQVAQYTAAIANGGTLFAPHVAKLPIDSVPKREVAPDHAYELGIVRQGMRDNVTYGSGRALANMAFPVSGKTGTAQWHAEKATHAWFTAFAPSDKPEIVVTVLLEEGGEGSSVAVPVARRVLEEWWRMRAARGGAF